MSVSQNTSLCTIRQYNTTYIHVLNLANDVCEIQPSLCGELNRGLDIAIGYAG